MKRYTIKVDFEAEVVAEDDHDAYKQVYDQLKEVIRNADIDHEIPTMFDIKKSQPYIEEEL